MTLLWFQLLKVSGREGNLIAVFQEEHSRVLQQLQAFTFFPESQAAPKKPFERKSMERQSARRQPLGALVSPLCPVSGLTGEPGTPFMPALFLCSPATSCSRMTSELPSWPAIPPTASSRQSAISMLPKTWMSRCWRETSWGSSRRRTPWAARIAGS